jgi:hypothetical protein
VSDIALSLPVEPDLPHANIVLPPRAINPMYLDKAREEWGGPAALKQGNSSPSSHSGFGVAPGGHGAGETVDGPRPTLSPVPGGGKREIQDEDEWSTYYLAVSKRVGDEADHVDFIAPRAINPIYANVSHDQVYKRADSGPIFGSSGKPQMTDVHQSKWFRNVTQCARGMTLTIFRSDQPKLWVCQCPRRCGQRQPGVDILPHLFLRGSKFGIHRQGHPVRPKQLRPQDF